MKQEKKLDLAIMETAKIVAKYKARGLVALGVPGYGPYCGHCGWRCQIRWFCID